jgi:hypothetical protein
MMIARAKKLTDSSVRFFANTANMQHLRKFFPSSASSCQHAPSEPTGKSRLQRWRRHVSESDKALQMTVASEEDAFVDVSGERWTWWSKRCSGFLYQGVVMIELSGRIIYLL